MLVDAIFLTEEEKIRFEEAFYKSWKEKLEIPTDHHWPANGNDLWGQVWNWPLPHKIDNQSIEEEALSALIENIYHIESEYNELCRETF